MKNLKLKPFLYLILAISLIIFLVFFYANGIQNLNISFILKTFPKVVTINIILIGLFAEYFWKWKYFRNWLVPFPNLNGTWKGYIHTTWVDPVTNDRPAPIPNILTINQNFFSISCVMRTGEMTSRSIISDFSIDKTNQIKRLYYTYDSNPLAIVRERSPQHSGSIYLDITDDSVRTLKGDYWTGRKTTGDIDLKFWKKEKLQSFPKDLGDHPVTEARK